MPKFNRANLYVRLNDVSFAISPPLWLFVGWLVLTQAAHTDQVRLRGDLRQGARETR